MSIAGNICSLNLTSMSTVLTVPEYMYVIRRRNASNGVSSRVISSLQASFIDPKRRQSK